MRNRRRPGTIVQVDLGEGLYTYARDLQHPFMAVYDARTDRPLSLNEIVAKPSLFTVAVYDHSFQRWKRVGFLPLSPGELPLPSQFVQDSVDPSVCWRVDVSAGRRYLASIEECENLECAIVWDQGQVEERIRDHYSGRRNQLLDMTKIKRQSH